MINFQRIERRLSHLPRNHAIRSHLCIVAYTLEQAVNYTRRATSAASNLFDPFLVCRYIENTRRAGQDLFERTRVIVFQAVDGPEPVPYCRRQCTCPLGSSPNT